MIVKVFRSNGAPDEEAHYDTFRVPYAADGSCTVMDVLNYIGLHLDHTLSYYRHSACNHGICGRCLIRANGRSGLACELRITGETLLLEPAIGQKKLVRDLVVE